MIRLPFQLSEGQRLLLGAVALFIVLIVYTSATKIRDIAMIPFQPKYSESAVTDAVVRMLEVGRLAMSPKGPACYKPRHASLVCSAFDDKLKAYYAIRFSVSKGRIIEEQKHGNRWEIVTTFPHIASMEICDDTDIASNSCGIPNNDISRNLTNLGLVRGNFFRLRIWAIAPKVVTRETPLFAQTAFFVRNTDYLAGESR